MVCLGSASAKKKEKRKVEELSMRAGVAFETKCWSLQKNNFNLKLDVVLQFFLLNNVSMPFKIVV